ncbi:MAG: N-6 DNA methylase [Thermofilum sp.]|nr:N-6 DNA methylase [Thermofilum sp.]
MSVRITEPSLYPYILEVLAEAGAKVVPELIKSTKPDFVVDWLGERWLVSVKIGDFERSKFIKDAFIQLYSELQDFQFYLKGSDRAVLLIYPEEIRKIAPDESEIRRAVRESEVYAVVLKPQMERRDPLPDVLKYIEETLRKKIPISLSLQTVTRLLKAHMEELMNEIEVKKELINILEDPELFFGINPIKLAAKNAAEVTSKKRTVIKDAISFLAAYIFLSQVLFLRFYYEKAPTFLEGIDPRNIGRKTARKLFNKLKDINYRPIFDIDVLDYVHEKFIKDTFKLIFALQIDNIRYELPGRLFHELMPKRIRKLLAAFYTRPIAAYLLAQLTINDPNATVFDPACGSGTILTMAYRRKLELWKERGLLVKHGNPHKKFCEEQIFGCDIMPFAVHITNANLVAMDPLTPVDYTQIVHGDSLKLAPSMEIPPGYRMTLAQFLALEEEAASVEADAYNRYGEKVKIQLRPVDVILMNPPFTKVERGISKYINIDKFESIVGREVGLWGHFVALANAFLKTGGVFGAVLPINLLRGRESRKVREMIFKQWLPLYVIKPSRNYGFSEYAEYRDILVIAKKTKEKPMDHKVKFCIIKRNLNDLNEEEVRRIAELIKTSDKLRSDVLDIDSYSLQEVYNRFDNMMYLIAGPSLEGLEALRKIIEEAERLFQKFPMNYFKEGCGSRPGGSFAFMFITRPGRNKENGRLKESFLRLESEDENTIIAVTPVGRQKFKFSKKHFLPALRTPVGLRRMDISGLHDYVAKEPYEDIELIMRLAGFKNIDKIDENYWEKYVKREFKRAAGYAVVVRRMNPYSPEHSLLAFNSSYPIIAADVFRVINEPDENRRKAIVVLLNSIFSLAYIFCGKEETTGRYIDVRDSELYQMSLYPRQDQVEKLVKIYEKYKDVEFPPLRMQLDVNYVARYESFWAREEKGQATLSLLPQTVQPYKDRLEFDLEVARSVNANLTKDDIIRAYEAIVWDMIITRRLRKD